MYVFRIFKYFFVKGDFMDVFFDWSFLIREFNLYLIVQICCVDVCVFKLDENVWRFFFKILQNVL